MAENHYSSNCKQKCGYAKMRHWGVYPLLGWVILSLFNSTIALSELNGRSVYTLKPEDPKAVYLTKEHFDVAADGVGDDTAALQAAIDLVESQSGRGIVFIPEGTYRLTGKVNLWVGIRLIGYGENRPTFKLADHTPGYQKGEGKYMIHFVYTRPDGGSSDIQDGNWSTHYSEINNIDFEIGDGNPAAIAVRFNVAQGSNLKNIDFRIGQGRGGVEEMGNLIENCRFYGGQWGIKTGSSPAGWQCTVMDCVFDGQREASIITWDAGMTIIRDQFKHAPIGISAPGNEKLFVTDSWFEDIKETAVQMNGFSSLQANFDHVKFAHVPYSIRMSGRVQGAAEGEYKMDYESPGPIYEVETFSHGLHIENSSGDSVVRTFETKMEQSVLDSLGSFPSRDIPALPDQSCWINILDMGAKGDGISDDTAVIEKAIESGETIYFPMGRYLLSRPLRLRDKTMLIGMHPVMTQFVLASNTPQFANSNEARALLETFKGGLNGISGIGFDLGINPGVIGVKWTAGSRSFMKDVRFAGRHKQDCQRHSIWVTDGGGGTFKNMWIVDWGTTLPFVINDTSTPGRIYQVSVEHHNHVEIKLEQVENWSFYTLQTEEFRGCEKTLPIQIENCSNLLFANLICYRTTGVFEPFLTAIQLNDSKDISIRGCWMRSGGPFPFDHSVYDASTGMKIGHREFTRLDIH